MLSRKIKYFFAYILDFIRSWPSLVGNNGLYFGASYKFENGIRIVDAWQDVPKQFVSVIEPAVGLIQQNDPLRYARLRREIRMIVNQPCRTDAAYSRIRRFCAIDMEKFKPLFDKDYNAGIRYLACVLIHEATHGVLYTRGIIQTKQNYARVERLCVLEEERFARKLGDEVLCHIFRELRKNTIKPPSSLERIKTIQEAIHRLRQN
jgi:hypothetical protein